MRQGTDCDRTGLGREHGHKARRADGRRLLDVLGQQAASAPCSDGDTGSNGSQNGWRFRAQYKDQADLGMYVYFPHT